MYASTLLSAHPVHYFSLTGKSSLAVTLSHFTKEWVPVFTPATCSSCHDVIRGPMFQWLRPAEQQLEQSNSGRKRERDLTWSAIVCESCFLEKKGQNKSHDDEDSSGMSCLKIYKHCILDTAITATTARKLCRCTSVARTDPSGRYRTLFPIEDQVDRHRPKNRAGRLQCVLSSLGDLVAEAKYDGMQGSVERGEGTRDAKVTLWSEEKRLAQEEAQKKTRQQQEDQGQPNVKKSEHGPGQRWRKKGHGALETVTEHSLQDEQERTGTEGRSSEVEEAEADEDIPFFMRRCVEKYPFGNVHMALRVGPLAIENGVSQ